MEPVGKVYEAWRKVMSEVGSVGKNHRNTFQNYSFVSIGDIMAAIQPLLVKHNIILQPQYTVQQLIQLDKGFFCSVVLHLGIWSTEDGSGFTIGSLGSAADSSDKCHSKAMAMCLKYALRQSLCIPDHEDGDAFSPEVKAKPAFTGNVTVKTPQR